VSSELISSTASGATPSVTSNDEELLSPDFLRKLEQLSLVLTRAFAGRMHGVERLQQAQIDVGDIHSVYACGQRYSCASYAVWRGLAAGSTAVRWTHPPASRRWWSRR
jgi:hypothetical protein